MGTLRNRSLAIAAVMLALSATQKSRGNTPYLKQIGPAPLRFSPALAEIQSFTLPASLIEHTSATNNIKTTASRSLESQTNNFVDQSVPFLVPDATVPIPATSRVQNNSGPVPSASEMLVVSPQMLAEFFKPGADATNGIAPTVGPAVPVGFTPPSPLPASRATYNSP